MTGLQIKDIDTLKQLIDEIINFYDQSSLIGSEQISDGSITYPKLAPLLLSGTIQKLITGTPGAVDRLAKWDANGNLVDSGDIATALSQVLWDAGTDATESLISPIKLRNTVGVRDSQLYLNSDTWTKPLGIKATQLVLVRLWAGGGGGGGTGSSGGGGGGAYVWKLFTAAELPDSVAIGIGAAGAIATPGGDTTFGALLTAFGGGSSVGGGFYRGGGGGGSRISKGGNGSTGVGGTATGFAGNGGAGSNGASTGANTTGQPATDGGGGGGGGGANNDATAGNGGNAEYGGGGGGGGGEFNADGVGGVSKFSGNGGDYNLPGEFPSGGGGALKPGADGKAEVFVL